MRRTILRILCMLSASVVILGGFATETTWACTNAQSCSTSYQVDEVYFGTGGSLDSTCSTSYCAKQSVGELTVGNDVGTNYQAQAGFNTNRIPSLTLNVNDATCQDYHAGGVSINLGYLSTGSTKTANANFSVKTYLASGYTVTTAGNPPVSNGPSPHTLAALTSGGTSSAGTEQFGINLVHNTALGIGNNVQQLPSSSFGFGAVSAGYNTDGTFRYNSGDTIASSTKSSGTTCYDMSYIFNISSTTPAGVYTMSQSVVATSTF